jgi:hypothetical protein
MMDAQEPEWLTTPQARPWRLHAPLSDGGFETRSAEGMKLGRDWLVQKSEVLATSQKWNNWERPSTIGGPKTQSEDEDNRAE